MTEIVRLDGIKLFCASKASDRAKLGDRVTSWIFDHPERQIIDIVVKQSSDAQFHCLTIALLWGDGGAGWTITGAKVFSSAARKRHDDVVGDAVSAWITMYPDRKIVSMKVVQSSDAEYHCYSLIVFWQLVSV